MKAFKGFNRVGEELTCVNANFVYEEGKEYEEDGQINICENGFHSCEYPLDCFKYYKPSTSEFHEVYVDGTIVTDDEDTKMASSKIKIGKKLSIAQLVKEAIDYTFSKTDIKTQASYSDKNHTASVISDSYRGSQITTDSSASLCTGECDVSSIIGDYSASLTIGHHSLSSVIGMFSAAASTSWCDISSVIGVHNKSESSGHSSISVASGNNNSSSSDGDYSISSVTGRNSVSSANGKHSISSVSGFSSVSLAIGDYSVAIATGQADIAYAGSPTSIAVAFGYRNMAAGVIGSHLVLTEWTSPDDDYDMTLKSLKMIEIDGTIYKENMLYYIYNDEIISADYSDVTDMHYTNPYVNKLIH